MQQKTVSEDNKMDNDNWDEYSLGQLLSYEQPTAYIVKSTDYDDKYKTPVLTAGKTFILGYTNEEQGVYDALPVIIFDDFTTASQFVNFKFKVKSSAMKILTANTELVLTKFIFYRMQVIKFDSSTHKRYWIQHYSKIKVGIPPISEQERIVARIDELFSQLDASVAELKTAKERLKVYRQAVLKEAFAKFHAFTSLKQASERIFDGPFGSNLKTADYVEQGVRVVRLENVKNAWFDNAKRSFVTREKYQTISSHTVYPDDLIMSTFISEDIKICQLPVDVGFAVNKADCIGIRLKSGINPRFVMFYLASREAYNALIHQVHGATRPRVNTKQIKAMQIPVAKLREQDTTVIEIEEKMSICDSIEKTVDTALQQAEALRQSILKKAFEGRLV